MLTAASCLTDHPLSRYRIVVGQNELSQSYFIEPHESTITAQSVIVNSFKHLISSWHGLREL